jgi:catechol 2,3-dioxygenase-like lactoylglutathione lyase family enzyme
VLAVGALLWACSGRDRAGGSLARPTNHPIEEVRHVATIRYIVDDVDAAISFYTERLGFGVVMHPAPPFAMLQRNDLRLLLSAPVGTGGGAQGTPDGRRPEPGGWNRFQIEVADLDATVADLRDAGLHFRNEIVTGIGGRQVLLDDPSGNAIELFEPARG